MKTKWKSGLVILLIVIGTGVVHATTTDYGTVSYSPPLTNAITLTNTSTTNWVISRIVLTDMAAGARVFEFNEDESTFVDDSVSGGDGSGYFWGTYCGDPSSLSASNTVTVAPGDSCFVAVSFRSRSVTPAIARVRFYDASQGQVDSQTVMGTGEQISCE